MLHCPRPEPHFCPVQMVLKCADMISNQTRLWDLCQNWNMRIMEEFFRQEDAHAERDLQLLISFLCDRHTYMYSICVSDPQKGMSVCACTLLHMCVSMCGQVSRMFISIHQHMFDPIPKHCWFKFTCSVHTLVYPSTVVNAWVCPVCTEADQLLFVT